MLLVLNKSKIHITVFGVCHSGGACYLQLYGTPVRISMPRDPVAIQREDKRGKYNILKMVYFYYGLEALVSLGLLYEVSRPYSLTHTTHGSTTLYE
jgi:hypothetical protein